MNPKTLLLFTLSSVVLSSFVYGYPDDTLPSSNHGGYQDRVQQPSSPSNEVESPTSHHHQPAVVSKDVSSRGGIIISNLNYTVDERTGQVLGAPGHPYSNIRPCPDSSVMEGLKEIHVTFGFFSICVSQNLSPNLESLHIQFPNLWTTFMRPEGNNTVYFDLSIFSFNKLKLFSASDISKETLLMYAVRKQYKSLTNKLFKYGVPDINAKNVDNVTALMFASDLSSNDIVKRLIEMGALVNDIDVHGRTALHYAAAKGDRHTVNNLLNGLADVEALDDQNITPLMLAASSGQLFVVSTLLERGANHLPINAHKQNAIQMARLNGHENVATTIENFIQKSGREDPYMTPLKHSKALRSSSDDDDYRSSFKFGCFGRFFSCKRTPEVQK